MDHDIGAINKEHERIESNSKKIEHNKKEIKELVVAVNNINEDI